MIQKHPKTLLTVITEAVLEAALVRDLRELGAQGWTVAEVHGSGSEGTREGAWEADRTIEMKVICDAAIADAIAGHLLSTYSANYSLVLYFSAVSVVRPDRY
jgi:predicted nuclease with RNAse H fold